MAWLEIENWDRFQHYKDRRPPWIKLYTELGDKDEFRELTMAERGLLVSIWVEYATSQRRLRDEPATLTRRLGQRVRREHLEALSHAGFIRFSDSEPLARCYHDASPEVEEEKEPPPTPPEGGNGLTPISKKDMRKFTGCRETRGAGGRGYKRDPLGKDRPPVDWPYDKPTQAEVESALAERVGA